MKLDALVLATVVGTVLAAGRVAQKLRPPAEPLTRDQTDALRMAPDHIEPGPQEPIDRQMPNKAPPEEDKGTPEQKLFALAEFSTGRTPEELRAELQALLADGVDVNAKTRGNTNALLLAAWKGSIDMIKLLVEAGADVDQSGALFSAAARGDVEICAYLLNNGASAEKKSITGETALQFDQGQLITGLFHSWFEGCREAASRSLPGVAGVPTGRFPRSGTRCGTIRHPWRGIST